MVDTETGKQKPMKTFRLRSRGKAIAALAAVLLVSVVTWNFGKKTRERKEFVSKADAQGYQYRFTISTDWKPAQSLSPTRVAFTMSPIPTREWIAVHLLRQPLAATAYTWEPTLLIDSRDTPTSGASPFINIQHGFPETDLQGPRSVTTERHLRIDGCPATLLRGKFSIRHNQGIAGTYLCVCTPDLSDVYVVNIMADSRYTDQIDSEMEAIVASFHVEKVRETSPGGKQ